MSTAHSNSILLFSAFVFYFEFLVFTKSLRARNGLNIWLAFDPASSSTHCFPSRETLACKKARSGWQKKLIFSFLAFHPELRTGRVSWQTRGQLRDTGRFRKIPWIDLFFAAFCPREWLFSGGCTCVPWWCHDSETRRASVRPQDETGIWHCIASDAAIACKNPQRIR